MFSTDTCSTFGLLPAGQCHAYCRTVMTLTKTLCDRLPTPVPTSVEPCAKFTTSNPPIQASGRGLGNEGSQLSMVMPEGWYNVMISRSGVSAHIHGHLKSSHNHVRPVATAVASSTLPGSSGRFKDSSFSNLQLKSTSVMLFSTGQEAAPAGGHCTCCLDLESRLISPCRDPCYTCDNHTFSQWVLMPITFREYIVGIGV